MIGSEGATASNGSNGSNSTKTNKEMLKLAKAARRSIRASATNKIRQIEAMLRVLEIPVEKLEDAMDAIVLKEDDLTQIDARVEALIEEDTEMEKEVTDAIGYKEAIGDLKSALARAIRKVTLSTQSSSVSTNSGPNTGNAGATGPTGSFRQKVRLPLLTIPPFSGNYENWDNFWGRFKATVDANQRLTKVEKLIYLTTYLEGDALKAIKGLTQTDASYDQAVNLLTNRFARTDLSINYHMSKLLEIQPAHDSKNLKTLRHLLDTCEISLRSLEVLGVDIKDKASFVCPAILKSLPNDIRTDYCVKHKPSGNRGNWDAKQLIDFIRDQIESREMAAILSGDAQKYKQKLEDEKPRYSKFNSERDSRNNRHTSTAKAFGTKVVAAQENGFCIFCKSNDHRSLDCKNYTLEKKREIIRETNRCFNCFRLGHRTRDCRSKFNRCKGCSQKHNYAICETNQAHKPKEIGEENTAIKETIQINSAAAKINFGAKTVLLQTGVGIMRNPTQPQKGERVRCFMDGGSEATFIREELSRKLKLPIVGEQDLEIYSCGNKNPKEKKAKLVKLRLENRNNPAEFSEIVAVELPFICYEAISSASTLKEIESHEKIKGLQLAEDTAWVENSKSECDLLIGVDFYWSIAVEEFVQISPLLKAQKTKLGWTIQGSTQAVVKKNKDAKSNVVKSMLVKLGEKRINETLETFWNLESIGIVEKENLDNSEEVILSNFFNEIKFGDNRYSVKLPWMVSKETLPDNQAVAVKRMGGLVKKFETNPKLYADYKAVINEQLASGIIEEVPTEQTIKSIPGTYYLPHQGVVRENAETTKLRVVFDASSHAYNVPSLNDCLAQGPNLYPDLLLLLLRFRKHKIAMVADIEKAFHQIKLDQTERDSTRFFWVQEIEGEISKTQFKTMRMTRVPFGVKSSPFLLACTIKYHLQECEKINNIVKEKLDKDLYVDDWVTGADHVREAYKISIEAPKAISQAGMKFRKWGTNSQKLLKLWNEHEEENLFEKGILQKGTKILGIKWEPTCDTIGVDLAAVISTSAGSSNTKRHMLSLISQVYDPMGVLSPFVVKGKILFQSLWMQRDRIGWDTETPIEISTEFRAWISELNFLKDFKVSRNYFGEANTEITRMDLHCFCDSSLKAFAAVIYIRYETIDNTIGTSLVVAKTRIAPVKGQNNQEQTIPRLELMGCLIGARLTSYVKGIFKDKLNGIYYWTDSTIAMGWVTSVAKSWKPFVSNRVTEIQNLTEKDQWGHCPGVENPADLPTRGMKADEMIKSKLWWQGPDWLRKSEIHWPKGIPEADLDSVSHEMRKLTLGIKIKEKTGIQCIIDLSRHNSLNKSLRITAYVFRYAFSKKGKKMTGPISGEEMSRAETFWIKHVQAEEYGEELEALKSGRKVEANSKIASLSPILHEELICVGGRIENSELSYERKHPIILNKDQSLSKLLVLRSHAQVMHSGVNDTITQNRERYWIPACRQLARKLIHDCVKCKRTVVKPADRTTAPLPSDRISEAPPFSIIGIDFAGPLYVNNGNNTAKVYICLATCAVTRAIHLELVPSLSTDEFIMALRRIISRRGLPTTIYTDNAQTFKKAKRDIVDIWANLKETELKEFFGNQGICWKFIVERAAWHGGYWEHLVRSTKTALRKILGQAALSYTELETMLLEVEALINSRPITYVYNDVREPTPLTPADFLIGHRLSALPPLKLKLESVPTTRVELTKRLKYRETILDQTWKRWRREYLMELKSAHHSKLAKNDVQFKAGDVVLIQEDRLPRHMWKIGLIKEVMCGRDGQIRMCEIKTKNGHVIRRAVQHLCNPEID